MRGFTRSAVVAAAIGALGIAGVGVASVSSAAPPVSGTVMAVTHTSHHPDTTNCVTSFLDPSSGSSVWAWDNLSRQITATPTGNGTWSVTIVDHGTFAAFSQPYNLANCNTFDNPISVTGPVKGTITYTLTSGVAPSAAYLPAQTDGAASTSETILQLFNNDPTATATIAYVSYVYTYGSSMNVYVQQDPFIPNFSGNIIGH